MEFRVVYLQPRITHPVVLFQRPCPRLVWFRLLIIRTPYRAPLAVLQEMALEVEPEDHRFLWGHVFPDHAMDSSVCPSVKKTAAL